MFTNGWVDNRLFYRTWYTTGVVFSTNVSAPALVFNSRVDLQPVITKNINTVMPTLTTNGNIELPVSIAKNVNVTNPVLTVSGNVSFLGKITKDINVIQNSSGIQGYTVVQTINNIIIENDTNIKCKFRDNNIDFY